MSKKPYLGYAIRGPVIPGGVEPFRGRNYHARQREALARLSDKARDRASDQRAPEPPAAPEQAEQREAVANGAIRPASASSLPRPGET